MFKKIMFLMALGILVYSCAKVPMSGRTQLALVDNAELLPMAFVEYDKVLKEGKVITNTADGQMVVKVGKRIASAVEKYMKANGFENELQGFQWEFNLIQEAIVNAWCMPGGKVAFYTGIIPICKDDNGIAVVMGHEIAHAIANHSGERMSQAMALNLGGQVGSILLSGRSPETQKAFETLYPIGAQVGVILPYSRNHELEADKMGLIFMAMAGYNPETAIAFWERMASSSKGGRPPQFLSTHPAEAARIDKIRAAMPEVMRYYKPVK